MISKLFVSRAAALIAIVIVASWATAQAKAPGYQVTRLFTTGGEGGWDYLPIDTTGNRLFLPRSTHVTVVDLSRDSVIGDIPNTLGVHGRS